MNCLLCGEGIIKRTKGKDMDETFEPEPPIMKPPIMLNEYTILAFWRKSDTRAVIMGFDADRMGGYEYVVARVSGHSLKYGEWYNSRYTASQYVAHDLFSTLTHPDHIV
jgi:hypothetical protein